MHHKDFNILIQRRSSKFFLINDFYLLGGGQSLGNGIGPLSKFFLGKLDVCIAENKKRHL